MFTSEVGKTGKNGIVSSEKKNHSRYKAGFGSEITDNC